jgi:diguanylate cyclase (GGDEF)-like protein
MGRFLCRDEQEREWMLDMHERLMPATRITGALTTAMYVAAAAWFELISLVPIAAGAVLFGVAIALANKRRDMVYIMGGLPVLQILLAVAILLNHRVPTDLWLLILAFVPASAGFPDRVVTALAAFTGALMAAVALAFEWSAVLAAPPALLLPLGALVFVALMSTAARRAAIDNRNAAVIDPLTGMLNRTSLTARSTELAHQTALTGEPVGLIVADLDHFKSVNDRFGHVVGDEVLVDLAYLLRKHVGAFGLAYRLGGEEFVLVLPGADRQRAEEVAEAIAAAVRSQPLAGVNLTLSLGVAASEPDTTFAFREVFGAADDALYAAKHAGRDCVRVASAAEDRTAPAAADRTAAILPPLLAARGVHQPS